MHVEGIVTKVFNEEILLVLVIFIIPNRDFGEVFESYFYLALLKGIPEIISVLG